MTRAEAAAGMFLADARLFVDGGSSLLGLHTRETLCRVE
jgi:hypothetical protein